ncbi:MAG: alpha/beta fold hydrolase [Bacteroidota bacterium]
MQLNYKQLGEGQPLIILHGLFGMLDNWQTLGKRFSEDFQVFLLDQRNHGKSDHNAVIDYPSMADDLYDFMYDHDLDQAHILGHSMGGKTAMQFAHTYPEKVNKLVVVDIAPKAYRGGHQLIFEALFNVPIETIESRKEVDVILNQKIDEVGIRLFLMKNLMRNKDGGYKWKMNLDSIHHHYEDILSAIRPESPFSNPTLFIKGENSNYIKEKDNELILAQFPNSNIETVAKTGHWVHAEAPDTLFSLVKGFLNK